MRCTGPTLIAHLRSDMLDAPDGLSPDFAHILQRGTHLWPLLRRQSLFVTGGTGFFGRWLLESLRLANQAHGLGLRVTVLTRDPGSFQREAPALCADPAFSFIAGNVRDFAFPPNAFSHVLHMATTSAHETFAGEDPLAKFDTLVHGTRRVLDFATERGVKHFLFTSSGVVYQPNGEAPIAEASLRAPPTHDPATALGQAKRAAEFLCSHYAARHGWHLGLARCFSFAGPWLPLDVHYAIGNFIAQALAGQPITVRSDGSALRSYLYAGDLVVWLLTLLLGGPGGRPCNVGSDAAISISELAHLVRDLLAPQQEVHILGRPAASVGNPVRNTYVPDISLARQYQLETWTSLSDTIKMTAMHARSSACRSPALQATEATP